MTREGLPTGQMQEETQELLDEYNELYNWEYNDMVDFIKKYGEEAFREYYDDYHGQVDELGIEPVDAFIEVFSIDDVANVVDSYQGSYYSGADFAEQLCKDCGYTSNDMPHWIEIDWEKTWDNALSYDYYEHDGHIFSANW
jgi:hypothetical protein